MLADNIGLGGENKNSSLFYRYQNQVILDK